MVSELLGAPGRYIREVDCTTTCATCGQEQNLGDVVVDDSDAETIYECVAGCGPLLAVLASGRWRGEGMRIGSWVIRNARQVRVKPEGVSGFVLIPASSTIDA